MIIRIQNRLLRLLKREQQPRPLQFAVVDEFFKTDDFLVESGAAPNRLVHFRVQIADLALQRERAMGLVLAPADDVPSNDFTGLSDERQVGVPLGQFPCPVHVLHKVCVPNVLIEMTDAFVETKMLGPTKPPNVTNTRDASSLSMTIFCTCRPAGEITSVHAGDDAVAFVVR